VARFAIAIAGIAVVGVTILRHELWRDELQAWQIVRASHGLHSLVHNMRYEGHPILWYGLLYPIAHAHAGPGAMQLLQLVVASVTIVVAVWCAPFTLVQKLLFVFGYFVLYEYGVLARSYGFGAMLLVVTLAVAATSARRPWPIVGLLLGLTALTSAFGALVAVAVLAGLLVDEWLRRRTREQTRATPFALASGVVLTFAGLATAYVQAARPPDDTGIYGHWLTKVDLGLGASSSAAIWRALVPIPQLKHSYWNTNILHARASIVGLLGLLLFVGIAWILRDRPGAFVVWVAGAGLVVAFLYLRIGTATASRHVGHIFLCLVAAMWLAPTMTARRSTARANTRRNVLTVLLIVQVVAGVFAASLDLVYPFSNGLAMAQYIHQHDPGRTEIIGLPDTAASTVAGYLDQPLYYLAGARFGTYIVWDTARERLQPIRDVLQSYRPGGRHVLLLINTPVRDPTLHLRLLTHDDNGIVPDEHFWLYEGSAPA
jgi:hypothetical protein